MNSPPPPPPVRRPEPILLELRRAPAPAPPPPPADAEPLQDPHVEWRCEITWQASAFRATVRRPDGSRRPLHRSRTFKWMLRDAPSPRGRAFRAAVETLDAQLVGAGWERVSPGPKWYALRYVWPGADAPPPA